MMKKTAILLVFLILISFSCNKKYKFYAFYIEKKVEFTIPHGTAGSSVMDFDIQELLTNSAAVFEDKSTSSDLIYEITIESAYLDSSIYSNFNDLDIYITTEGQNEVLLANNDETNIFYRVSGTQYLEYVELKATTDLLDEYIKSDKITVRTTGELFEEIVKDIGITIHLRFLVKTYVK